MMFGAITLGVLSMIFEDPLTAITSAPVNAHLADGLCHYLLYNDCLSILV